MNPFIQAWLLQSAVIFLIIGSVAGLFIGALLVFRPQQFQRISTVLNLWVSTRALDKTLERSISIDAWFYRHRKIAGGFILAGGVFVLTYFTVMLDREMAITGLAKHFQYPALLIAGLLDALVLSSMLGAVCAIFVALCLMYRPSLLRGFEEGANQWVSMRKALKPMEIQRDSLNQLANQYARQTGIFLMLGGLYTLILMLLWQLRNL